MLQIAIAGSMDVPDEQGKQIQVILDRLDSFAAAHQGEYEFEMGDNPRGVDAMAMMAVNSSVTAEKQACRL